MHFPENLSFPAKMKILVVAVIFVKHKHTLLKDKTNTRKNNFFDRLFITNRDNNTMGKIIFSIYKDNMQTRKKNHSIFYNVNLSLLLILNIITCCR